MDKLQHTSNSPKKNIGLTTTTTIYLLPVRELYAGEGVVEVVLDDGGAGVDQLRV